MKVYVCEVGDKWNGSVPVRGIDMEEQNGTAYDKCMEFMNMHGNHERYEFFCCEDSIDFQWRITAEDFEKFRKDTEPNEEMDWCGTLFFGKFSLEFMHISDNVRYYNLFLLDEPGYNTLIDGTPYNECPEGWRLEIPKRRTLEGFQKAVEQMVYDMIKRNSHMIVDATSATEPERWYPKADGTYFSPTITRRA